MSPESEYLVSRGWRPSPTSAQVTGDAGAWEHSTWSRICPAVASLGYEPGLMRWSASHAKCISLVLDENIAPVILNAARALGFDEVPRD